MGFDGISAIISITTARLIADREVNVVVNTSLETIISCSNSAIISGYVRHVIGIASSYPLVKEKGHRSCIISLLEPIRIWWQWGETTPPAWVGVLSWVFNEHGPCYILDYRCLAVKPWSRILMIPSGLFMFLINGTVTSRHYSSTLKLGDGMAKRFAGSVAKFFGFNLTEMSASSKLCA